MQLTPVQLKEKIFNKQNYVTYINHEVFKVLNPAVEITKTDNILKIADNVIDIDSKSVIDVINILSETCSLELNNYLDYIETFYQCFPARCLSNFQSKITIKYKPTESILQYNEIAEYQPNPRSSYTLSELVHVVNGVPVSVPISSTMYLENLTRASNVFATYVANTLSVGLVGDYIANTPNQLFLPFLQISSGLGPGPGPLPGPGPGGDLPPPVLT